MSDSASLWQPQPMAADLVERVVADIVSRSEILAQLSARMRDETGTRLFDWLDHLAIPGDLNCEGQTVDEALKSAGFIARDFGDRRVLVHSGGMFPAIELTQNLFRAAIKVDSVVDFLVARRSRSLPVIGALGSRRRQVLISGDEEVQVWGVERVGDLGWYSDPAPIGDTKAFLNWFERVRLRDRVGEDASTGFAEAQALILEGNEAFGRDTCCAIFFEAERRYWQVRNRAGQLQKNRQDRLGLGWANHDHHTYRSSREWFRSLVQSLELMGFQRRERFYPGHNAGWGAQVLEQPTAGITVFADVDLSPLEIQGDFATEGLAPRNQFGTVGLWCALHGEAFLEAGMHHLECQFDFELARNQLTECGVGSMPPFTNFDYLRQCFTEGERWSVLPSRINRLIKIGALDQTQGERFLKEGAIGSHLEILERNDGFKGFNQTGISDIIAKTDPRTMS